MERIAVLCVDDEPNVLAGLTLHLGRAYRVVTAESGEAGLAVLAEQGPFAVVLSDMRMPGMDGAQFLARVREQAPDATRMLLTGHADIEAAISAINDGRIFRFLTKPCPPADLRTAFELAVEQYNLVVAERVLLGQTLLGSIKALTQVLALTSPLVFGRATRVTALVKDLLARVPVHHRWAVEVAAMLSELGCIGLPDEVAHKHHYGEPMTPAERQMVARAPGLTAAMLGSIPRLEPVLEILRLAGEPYLPKLGAGDGDQTPLGREADLLRLALEFEALETSGMSRLAALDKMRRRLGASDPLFAALDACRGSSAPQQFVRDVPLGRLRQGMQLATDLTTTTGLLLAARGYVVTDDFLARAAHFRPGYLREPIRVLVIEGGTVD
ncbi:MAG: response regulator [Armatimonadetes bacterium]|nr:response regulator [Armatimonadota bacterium]